MPIRRPGHVSLDRALSKLGLASRADARRLIREGRVAVNGRVVRNSASPVVPERVRISIDDSPAPHVRATRRVVIFHKPRGTVTTRRDPEGRKTVFDVLGDIGRGLVAVGRLDLASTGLLLLTNDTQLAHRLTDPGNRVTRRYVVTVRGLLTPELVRRLEHDVAAIEIRKASRRETHLLVDLTQGKNRELRRLFGAVGHEPTRIHRFSFGEYELGDLQPGQWREVS